MRYVDWLHRFIGSEVQVTVSGDFVVGTLIDVGDGTITLKLPATINGPPTETTIIPLLSVEYIRVLSG